MVLSLGFCGLNESSKGFQDVQRISIRHLEGLQNVHGFCSRQINGSRLFGFLEDMLILVL